MPEIARQERNRYYTEYHSSRCPENIYSVPDYNTQNHIPKRKKARRKRTFIQTLIALTVLVLLIGLIMPSSCKLITSTIFNPLPHKNIQTDMHSIAFPTSNYLSNSWIFGNRIFAYSNTEKNAQMEQLKTNVNMPLLEQDLVNLGKLYPTVKPSIFVWDYETQNYINLNGEQPFATASIIKIPILIQLFKAIEAGQVSLEEKMPLTEYYRTEGSGNMQFKAANSEYTIDEIAKRMITDSDNSATNMLISKLGSMNDINQAVRAWGLTTTQLHTWLPDLGGTNISTAKELATMLYNIDENNKFLTEESRTKMFSYMGHVHNNRLVNAGLGNGAVFLHKTGDIGSMLGDAGIVIAPNGKKYIVVILANRPHNSVAGKDYIVHASEIIYNYMVK